MFLQHRTGIRASLRVRGILRDHVQLVSAKEILQLTDNPNSCLPSRYMPKDEPSDGLGHRHDWENAVVFLSENSSDATFVAMVVSEHGGYVTGTATFDGTHPYVGYISYWPVDHTLIFTTTEGGTQPLIAWEDLTDAARDALDTTDFGDATASFKDSNFQSYLADAYSTAF